MGSITLPERILDIEVPPELIADHPVEAEGRRRDDVRMLVAERSTGRLTHARAADLDRFLRPGDVLVVNTSPTLPAAVPADDGSVVVHLSTHLGGTRWVVEVREPCGFGSRPHPVDHGMVIPLAAGGLARLRFPYSSATDAGGTRLWQADVVTPGPLADFLAGEGRPIRYGCTDTAWPIGDYQTDLRHDDRGRPRPRFGGDAVRRPTLHARARRAPALDAASTSLPSRCTPACPPSRRTNRPTPSATGCPPTTAQTVNDAHQEGRRVIAVGTTATRALETDAADGRARPGEGWTELVITPERGLEVVDGIISGWHEPEASHLLLMEAVAGRPLLEASYDAALHERYRWHEFGDIHLVLP